MSKHVDSRRITVPEIRTQGSHFSASGIGDPLIGGLELGREVDLVGHRIALASGIGLLGIESQLLLGADAGEHAARARGVSPAPRG